MEQGGSCDLCKESVRVDVRREWDFCCALSIPPRGKITIGHINGKRIFQLANGCEILDAIFPKEALKQMMNSDDIFGNTLKCRCIQTCECQTLPKVLHMGTGCAEGGSINL
jgi:hypothetical protein